MSPSWHPWFDAVNALGDGEMVIVAVLDVAYHEGYTGLCPRSGWCLAGCYQRGAEGSHGVCPGSGPGVGRGVERAVGMSARLAGEVFGGIRRGLSQARKGTRDRERSEGE